MTRHREQTELSQPRYRKSKMKVLAKILKGLASFCLVGSHCYNLICRCAWGEGRKEKEKRGERKKERERELDR